jgi:hypothetical protein
MWVVVHDLIRESPLCQVIRLFSRCEALRYVEEQPDFERPSYVMALGHLLPDRVAVRTDHLDVGNVLRPGDQTSAVHLMQQQQRPGGWRWEDARRGCASLKYKDEPGWIFDCTGNRTGGLQELRPDLTRRRSWSILPLVDIPFGSILAKSGFSNTTRASSPILISLPWHTSTESAGNCIALKIDWKVHRLTSLQQPMPDLI